jgi:hypothetical protein
MDKGKLSYYIVGYCELIAECENEATNKSFDNNPIGFYFSEPLPPVLMPRRFLLGGLKT